jgi:hypothetical protein
VFLNIKAVKPDDEEIRVVLDNSSKTLESQYLSIIQIQYHAKDGLRNHI